MTSSGLWRVTILRKAGGEVFVGIVAGMHEVNRLAELLDHLTEQGLVEVWQAKEFTPTEATDAAGLIANYFRRPGVDRQAARAALTPYGMEDLLEEGQP
jgi:predicted NAD/FAD-dependent oxidoreductase